MEDGKIGIFRYRSFPSRSTDILLGADLYLFLETATETAVVVDGEGTDQVNRGRSAESNTQTFGYVHGSFAAISLTEGDLHTGKG